ncbi:hypothetical protein Z517_06570 [Fonsecaea pedrosoi CBS 271.37]|uniref:Unplaced genomic scaffold supercont1.4, whole genome shotgun sequence n=1 Tax=Fonsecaea pedrosoi CBS 271.37 TaxID=1442368 RepID=A0A0D2GN48_9EURO|nr:uncharacterized protein Z517_06570 [Fonsecaea pedrosoi CBS 271.37]KIW79955.1 hypothetical protein Z517_06570 [Fonsecaea pedrosoi CBS 271.37]
MPETSSRRSRTALCENIDEDAVAVPRAARTEANASESAFQAPRDIQLSAMQLFEKHASQCERCEDPYGTYERKDVLCDIGTSYAINVVNFIYIEGGRLFPTIDLRRGNNVKVEVPTGMYSVNLLFKAIGKGMKLESTRATLYGHGTPYVEETGEADPSENPTSWAQPSRHHSPLFDDNVVEIQPHDRRADTRNASYKDDMKQPETSSVSFDRPDQRERLYTRGLDRNIASLSRADQSKRMLREYDERRNRAALDRSGAKPPSLHRPDDILFTNQESTRRPKTDQLREPVVLERSIFEPDPLEQVADLFGRSPTPFPVPRSLFDEYECPYNLSPEHYERSPDLTAEALRNLQQQLSNSPCTTTNNSGVPSSVGSPNLSSTSEGRQTTLPGGLSFPFPADSAGEDRGLQSDLELCSLQILNDRQSGMERGTTSNPYTVRMNENMKSTAAFSDSGYASGRVEQPAEAPPQTQYTLSVADALAPANDPMDTKRLEASRELSKITATNFDDIISVISDEDDIHSRAESHKSRQVLAAEDQILAFFAHHNEIFPLCSELLPQMGRYRFVNNFRRLLKPYYKAQLGLANINIEKSTTFLLRSRFLRERIARSIADRLDPEEEIRLEAEKHLGDIQDHTGMVQQWLETQKAFALKDDVEHNEDDQVASLSEDDDDDDDEEYDDRFEDANVNEYHHFPHIDKMKKFLGSSAGFRKLLIDLNMLLLPQQYRSIAHSLLAIPTDSIKVAASYKITVSNALKIRVEEATMTEWNWWPLEPSVRPPLLGFTRISWKCYCNRSQWRDIPDAYIANFNNLLTLKRHDIFGSSICARTFSTQNIGQHAKRVIPAAHNPPLKTSPSSSDPSSSGRPSNGGSNFGIPTSPGQLSSSSASQSPSRPSIGSGHTTSSATSMTSVMNSVNIPSRDRFVVFGIHGKRRTLDIVHINTTKDNDDVKFLDTLFTSYRALRGRMRLWFSIWQLHHCEFVKFKKILPDRVLSAGPDLPSCPIDYSYDPRPPDPRAPALDKHVWELALLRPCRGATLGVNLQFCLLSWLHDCLPPLGAGSNIYLPTMPQKHSEWLLKTPGIDYAWGIEAVEEPYIIILIMYHVLMLAAPFGFWAWWLVFEHARTGQWDLQDASIPVSVFLVLLSLFWAAAKPLKVFDTR